MKSVMGEIPPHSRELIRSAGEAMRDQLVGAGERSSKWRKVREEFIAANGKCMCCGGTDMLNVHHIRPFHLYPGLELDTSNLITLCEEGVGGMNCHLIVGHLGNWVKWNVNVIKNSKYLNTMFSRKK